MVVEYICELGVSARELGVCFVASAAGRIGSLCGEDEVKLILPITASFLYLSYAVRFSSSSFLHV